jgi:hypothetical protein
MNLTLKLSVNLRCTFDSDGICTDIQMPLAEGFSYTLLKSQATEQFKDLQKDLLVAYADDTLNHA